MPGDLLTGESLCSKDPTFGGALWGQPHSHLIPSPLRPQSSPWAEVVEDLPGRHATPQRRPPWSSAASSHTVGAGSLAVLAFGASEDGAAVLQ